MTEFETKALELLKSIDESLKLLKEAASRSDAREQARLQSSFPPDMPPGLAAAQGILNKRP
jgi:hypothetical protein